MQFSKKVTQLSRLHGIDPKDVLFALLNNAGASAAEAFAVIYRPATSTTSALASKASIYISQRPGLRRLIEELNEEKADTNQAAKPAKRGRPRGTTQSKPQPSDDDRPSIDYNDKDALLQELARIAERSEKDTDKLAALREIGSLQRMKQEQNTAEEKRVHFYIPLTYERAEELRQLLADYKANK